MKIVIAGAGDMGFHLARLLSSEKQEIVLIDIGEEELEVAQMNLDVFTLKGDCSSIQILKDAQVENAKLFLAVTTSEKTNLLACILAKRMGAKQTIARVDNSEYLEPEQRKNFSELGIDHLISPLELAKQEIKRLIIHCEVTDNFTFEEGQVSLNGIIITNQSPWVGRSLSEVSKAAKDLIFTPVAILRDNKTILPKEDLIIQFRDHIYFLTPETQVNALLTFLGIALKKIRNIMILGGGSLAKKTALLLENKYNLTLVEQDKDRCRALAELLNNTLIIKTDPSNVDLLKKEGMDRMDAVISLTDNSETNIITCLTANRMGVYKTIALVDNRDYVKISQQIGVDTLINTKLISANNIFRFVRRGKVEAIAGMHGVDAEIIEYLIHRDNQLTSKPVSKLPLPDNAMIAAVIRNKNLLVPDPDFTLDRDDKVIVVAATDAISKVDRLFR